MVFYCTEAQNINIYLSVGASVLWYACEGHRETFNSQCYLTTPKSRYQKAVTFSCQALLPTK